MGVVVLDFEIVDPEIVDTRCAALEDQFRKRPRLASELQSSLLKMVEIKMNIASNPDELSQIEIALLGNHGLQGNRAHIVERATQIQIDAPLHKHTGKAPFAHMKLISHMARR